MKAFVIIFALSFLYVTAKSSSHIVSNDFEGNTSSVKDINNGMVKTIVVDHFGRGTFKTIQSAIDSIPSGNNQWIKISIREGIYNEQILIRKDKPKIQLVGNVASKTIIQYPGGGDSISSATFRLYAEFFVAINITFKNTYNEEKPMTPYGKIKVAPAIILAADKAAFYGCRFFGIQDTIGDLLGRHYFQHCKISGSIDFIWGGGQSIYQSCIIEVLGVVAPREQETENGEVFTGFITAQGRESMQDTSGFVFNRCSIVGVGKAFLGRAYRGYSRVIFSNTYMSNVIVPQGWDAWSSHPGIQVDNLTYVEVNCIGPGAKKERRVGWEKHLSREEVSYFTNRKTFVDKDGWMETLPPLSFY